jgi:hypothetical protein
LVNWRSERQLTFRIDGIDRLMQFRASTSLRYVMLVSVDQEVADGSEQIGAKSPPRRVGTLESATL